jgi:hypothetical protein
MDKPSQHFKRTVGAWFEVAQEGVENGLLDVLERAVNQTPIDSGASKGNWQAVRQLEETKPFVETKTSNTADRDIHRLTKTTPAMSKGFTTKELDLVNPTPYALDWELGRYPRESAKVTADGFSRQAPDGVVTVFEKQDSITLANAVKHVLEKF